MSILPNQSFETQILAWKKYGLELLRTGDGSPTLRENQTMHHLGGALSETNYIYGDLLRRGLPFKGVPQALVVGLGLGYIEHLCARYFSHHQVWELGAQIVSYEAREDLRALFEAYLVGPAKTYQELDSEVLHAFRDVENRTNNLSLGFERPSDLRRAFKNSRFEIRGVLEISNLPDQRFDFIFFDAYSAAASPELWTEEFFEKFLNTCASPQCSFSTYACTGILQRALKKAGFEVIKRPGFQGKRESLSAFRGRLV
jgi:hypothetical protein